MFSLAKLVDNAMMSSTKLVFKKNSNQALSDLLRIRILEIFANPVMEQLVYKWEICYFMMEMIFHLKDLRTQLPWRGRMSSLPSEQLPICSVTLLVFTNMTTPPGC